MSAEGKLSRVRDLVRSLRDFARVDELPTKTVSVAPLIGEDAVETYELREMLESEALRQSIPLLDASDIGLARDYISQLENETRHAEIGRLNRLFHMTLYSKAGNKKLLRLIDNELCQEERFLRFHLSSMGLGKLTQDDHNGLVDAANDKAIDEAIVVLQRHLRNAMKTIRNYLDKQKP